MGSGTLSPDGQWLWTGSEWIPAPPPSTPQAVETASSLIHEMAQAASVDPGELKATVPHFDTNQDGILQPQEISMAIGALSNPPSSSILPPASVNPAWAAGLPRAQKKGTVNARINVRGLGAFGFAILIIGGLAFVGLSPDLSPFPTIRDSDTDGVVDADDAFPENPTQSSDLDGDGYGDSTTSGATLVDRFPDNPTQWNDSDDDGFGDNQAQGATQSDAFPSDNTQWTDEDGDGYGDNPNGTNPDRFPSNPTQWLDTDGDGYGDNQSEGATQVDLFINDSTEWADSDADGFGDNIDACDMEAGGSYRDRHGCVDSDSDGWSNAGDAYPFDASEHVDTDGDGTGNNADLNPYGDAELVFTVNSITASTSQSYDVGSGPDMFVRVLIDQNCDESYEQSRDTSTVYDDYTITSSNGLELTFDVDDDRSEVCYVIRVYDEDFSDDDLLDYASNPEWTAMRWTVGVYDGKTHNIEESGSEISIDITMRVD